MTRKEQMLETIKRINHKFANGCIAYGHLVCTEDGDVIDGSETEEELADILNNLINKARKYGYTDEDIQKELKAEVGAYVTDIKAH